MFSRSPSGSVLPADQQSVVPTVRGLPWWGAVLLATVVTIIGAFIDSAPSGELGRAFKIIFIIGCVLAALAVRRRALFTAAVQPPLIAFVIGLITLYLEAGDGASDKKTLILKVALPIATSFPWMLIAFVLSLAVVLARLFFTGPPSKRPFGGFGGFGSKAATRKPTRKPETSSGQKAKSEKSKSPNSTAPKARATAKKSTTARSATAKSSTGDPKRAAATPSKKSPADRAETRAPSKKTSSTPTRRPRPQPAAEPASASESTAARREPTRRPRRTNPAEAPAPRRSARPSAPSPTAAEPAPARPAATPADAAAPAERQTKRSDRRRAQPQKIPARPRRTAGQQLRERGAVEDLTAGLDD
ncbi:DUF6542 domain-containing protein [Gordonia sp. MP11Mi]|uniref:DUF6542 domain-containing protein n=1 Tax=Gordonia sp. MP11Mi TaxID=3022769 RepID=A0AA97CVJ1_9ACTN